MGTGGGNRGWWNEDEGFCRATGRRGSRGRRRKAGGSPEMACWGKKMGKFMEGMRSAEAGNLWGWGKRHGKPVKGELGRRMIRGGDGGGGGWRHGGPEVAA